VIASKIDSGTPLSRAALRAASSQSRPTPDCAGKTAEGKIAIHASRRQRKNRRYAAMDLLSPVKGVTHVFLLFPIRIRAEG